MSPRTRLSRRTVLKTMAMTASASGFPAVASDLWAVQSKVHPYPENGDLIPDPGWYLWPDTRAQWESDEIFLPEDVGWIDGKLCGKGKPLLVNAPTGGWEILKPGTHKEVALPTSVEQHFWGKYGAGVGGKPRPYTPEEYRYASTNPPAAPADDNIPQNGAYFGVSWFYRNIDIPKSTQGKRIFLHIRGAHLRAEVYLNNRLCGYSIMEELPFEADLTHAVRPGGENLLAIRITNPCGRFDWVDGLNAKWGKVSLYRSHGFGALDRGMTISVHDDERIKDAWVLNTPSETRVVAFIQLETSKQHSNLPVVFEIVDPFNGEVLLKKSSGIDVQSNDTAEARFNTSVLRQELTLPNAKPWDLGTPKLYHLRISVLNEKRTIAFGFRSFGPTGLGANAMFRLNGRRIRLYSAISWGFWGLNGMFPVPELAEKEVRAAQALGLNCLNFHRNLAKEDVLRKHDELGLLRYMEPGAGKLALGRPPKGIAPNSAEMVMGKPESEAEHFAQRFMFVKCVEMVKAFRSHPSVIEYCLQNEIGADLQNPATMAVVKAMHDEDHSRAMVLNDGFVARGAAQAWFEPWTIDETSGELHEGKLHRSDEEAWGAWWNNHQGAGDQWYDQFYKSPTEYTYKAPFREVLTEFGEMEGCARPDDHPLMVNQIKTTYAKYGGDSYDLADHEEIVAGHDAFLDKWGFRAAFPTSESIFKAAGRTCYESWMNYMENARISDELDFAVISGWESTAIENHSGIVDNLRNFKSDPGLIGGSLLPIRPIAKQRSLVIERGKPAVFDLYLANDTPEPAAGTLTLTMVTPGGRKQTLITLPAPQHVADRFSYLLKSDFTTPPLTDEGLYRFRFAIDSSPLSAQTRELWVTGLPTEDSKQVIDVAVSGIQPQLREQLEALSRSIETLRITDFKEGETYRAIISAGITAHTTVGGQVGETTGEQTPVMKPGHKPEPGEVAEPSELGSFAPGILDAVRNGTALLAIPQADTLSEGLARDLAAAGTFTYHGTVGDFRAPWMGNWYFVREHPIFAGMPANAAMGGFYQTPGRQSNGLLVDRAPNGSEIEVVVGYSRDHDRKVGAGTFVTRLGKGKVLFHRVPPMQSVMQQRFLANALLWLTA